MSNPVMPYVARAISSNRLQQIKRCTHKAIRVMKGQKPTLQVFLRLDDPYSFLLVQVLPAFLHRFTVNVQFHTVLNVQTDMYPMLDMWRAYALKDAGHLARLYGLDYPFNPSASVNSPKASALAAPSALGFSQALMENACAVLLEAENTEAYLDLAKQVFGEVWMKRSLSLASQKPFAALSEQCLENEARLKRKGHYFGAMLHFEGEWYWGIDRLEHLEKRLLEAGFAKFNQDKVRFNLTHQDFCQGLPPKLPMLSLIQDDQAQTQTPLIVYWSARSPYSYLGLLRALQLTTYYRVPLIIKPVLPMMMRGMQVPQNKKMYIFHDTKREANKLGIPYGFVGDPLGPAVERCYALLEYARSENKLSAFLLSFALAVNSEGVRAQTDKGMRFIVTRCGLSWEKARPLLTSRHWQKEVNENLDEMLRLGCWGVPSFRYQDLIVWGQDRLVIVEQHLRTTLANA